MCHPPQQTVHEQRRALTSNPAWTAGMRRRWDSAPEQLRPEQCWGTAGCAPPPGPGQGQALEGTAGRGGHGHCGLRGFSTPTPHSLQPPPAAARPLPPSRPPGLGGCPATPPLSRESPARLPSPRSPAGRPARPRLAPKTFGEACADGGASQRGPPPPAPTCAARRWPGGRLWGHGARRREGRGERSAALTMEGGEGRCLRGAAAAI